jgi:hypothetical protein
MPPQYVLVTTFGLFLFGMFFLWFSDTDAWPKSVYRLYWALMVALAGGIGAMAFGWF